MDVFCGLTNCSGVSCYQNSVVQCLICIKAFQDLLSKCDPPEDSLLGTLVKLMTFMNDWRNNFATPTEFHAKIAELNPQFAMGNQEDCQAC